MSMDWKPIAEAPKNPDGPMHSVLLGFEDVGDGGWPSCQGYWSQMLNDWVVASPFNPQYATLSQMTDYKPSHYMPLPPSPSA